MPRDEHEEEDTPEETAKKRRLHDKTKKFFADVSGDMVPSEVIASTEKKITNVLSAAGLTPTLSNLRAAIVGYEFGMASHATLGSEAMVVLLALNNILDAREKKTQKVDISKSIATVDTDKETNDGNEL